MLAEFDFFTTAERSKLRRNLRRWHRTQGRDLPWRQAGDAYRVWISEIMLQQTTVAAVVPYYERFLTRFPDVDALAGAEEGDVLRLWEGLGYYSRARNIHKTARLISGDYNGQFPEDVDELRQLPGIGRYTAGAIASFAFDRPAPIVEANTLRLYCRLLGYDGDPRSSVGQQLLWQFAARIVPKKSPGEFNQALMDLGATVCTPTEPKCPVCPLRTVCRAYRDDLVARIPQPKTKIPVTEVVEASIAVWKRGRFLLRRRGEGERWAGLWDFLRFEVAGSNPQSANVHRQLIGDVRDQAGLAVTNLEPIKTLRHSVTRYRITLYCLRAEVQSGRLRTVNGPFQWVEPSSFGDYALSVTGRQFADLLSDESV